MHFFDLRQKFTVAIGLPIDSEVHVEGEIARRELPGGWRVYLNDPPEVGAANAQTRLYLPLGD